MIKMTHYELQRVALLANTIRQYRSNPAFLIPEWYDFYHRIVALTLRDFILLGLPIPKIVLKAFLLYPVVERMEGIAVGLGEYPTGRSV